MRFALVFKKFIGGENLEIFAEAGFTRVYEDEDIALYSIGNAEFDGSKVLIGYRLHGSGPPNLKLGPGLSLLEFDMMLDGKYLMVDLDNSILFSDPLGLQPVYVSDGVLGSEKKIVKMASGGAPLSVLPPGRIYRYSVSRYLVLSGGVNIYGWLSQDGFIWDDMDMYIDEYLKLINLKFKALARYVNQGVKSVYISFSGGVDSSVVARLASTFINDVRLLTVCDRGSHDDRYSKLSASLLGLEDRHITRYVDVGDVGEYVYDVVRVIEEWGLMHVSLAIPVYLAYREYVDGGLLLMGQGSDEMFGGYSKYLDILRARGAEEVAREMAKDVLLSYRFNFLREQKLADWFGGRLEYPLLTPAAVAMALSCPLEFKIRGVDDGVRKWVVRGLAERLGLPDDIVYRGKKALQYSSRIQRLVVKALGKNYAGRLFDIYREVITLNP